MKIGMHVVGLVTAGACAVSACGTNNSPADDASGTGGGSGHAGTGAMLGGSSGKAGTTGGGGQATGGTGGSVASGTGGGGSGGTAGNGGHAMGGTSAGGAPGGTSAGGAPGGTTAGGTTGGGGQTSGAGGMGGAAGGMGGRGGAGAGGMGGATAGMGGASGGSGGTYNPCPTNGDPCRILPVGDSITFGINYEGSYRPRIFHDSLMGGQKITFTGTLQNGPTMVDNMPFPRRFEATSGITIDGISQQITKNKTLDMPADIVLIHIGTNDMYGSDPGGAPARLTKLIDQIATGLPNALIAVAKIIPLQQSASQVTTFNNAIPGVVQKEADAGKHVIMVDLNTGFPPGDMDAVHPYQSGYEWMGDKWYAVVGSLFPK